MIEPEAPLPQGVSSMNETSVHRRTPDEPNELPADMAEAIAALHLLDDEAPR